MSCWLSYTGLFLQIISGGWCIFTSSYPHLCTVLGVIRKEISFCWSLFLLRTFWLKLHAVMEASGFKNLTEFTICLWICCLPPGSIWCPPIVCGTGREALCLVLWRAAAGACQWRLAFQRSAVLVRHPGKLLASYDYERRGSFQSDDRVSGDFQ